MLIVDRGVTALFRVLMQIPQYSRVFIHNADQFGIVAAEFLANECKVSATCPSETGFYDYHKHAGYTEKNKAEVVSHKYLDMIKPPTAFQYAFGLPEFNDDATPIMGQDVLRQWIVSRTDSQYMAPRHLMGLEALFTSVVPGGFFGAICPRHWMGRYMKFMKYWRNEASMVAKIQLPRGSVKRVRLPDPDDYTPEQWLSMPEKDIKQYCTNSIPLPPVYSGNWFLLIWQKPVNKDDDKRPMLKFASQRYACHVSRLKPMDGDKTGLEEEAVEYCAGAFRKSDWSRFSVRPFQNLISDSKFDVGTYGKELYNPPTLRSPKDMRILKVSEDNKPSFKVCVTVGEIKRDPRAVHIKLGPPTKLYAYSPTAKSILLDLKFRAGYSREELQRENQTDNYRALDEFTVRLKTKTFADDREWLLKTLLEHGLQPYMTESDSNRLRREERWLSIQLTPVKRTIRAQNAEEGEEWEELYDDVDMKATFPEVWNLWEMRARKMKLHLPKFTYGFQYEDVVTMACKQSLMNTNVMGLGKTRETLFSMMLRCSERNLLVIPTRLIGVWQEEIEGTIANYCRLVRRNWMGKIMTADSQVIQWARDCMKENLKTFNIVSYENLARIPKDALFFKCPACGFVVCSPKGYPDQACPKCNQNRSVRHKEMDRLAGNRKRKIWTPNGVEIMDDRVSSGNLVMMEQTEKAYDKMSNIKVGEEKTRDPFTNRVIRTPIFRDVERDPHLKWTFSHVLRNRFNSIACDETNYVNNPKAKRAVALYNLTARRRIGMTGTPFRGYPRSICNIFNWALKRSVFPDYRNEAGNAESGIKKFEKKYATFVQREGKAPKLIPKINQPELFQQEIAPFIIRHLRHEPNVAKDIPPRTPVVNNRIIPMDPQHRVYYQKWLDMFAEWWALKRKEEDKQANAAVVNDLLVKIGYLINASSIPHFMLDNLQGGEGADWAKVIGKYEGPLTCKFNATTQMILKNIEAGDKTIVGCSRVKNLTLGQAWSKKHKVNSIRIDGAVSNEIKQGVNRSEKQLRVDKFCFGDYPVMWAGIQTLKEGFNIPQANHAILMDWTWEPSDTDQFVARMLRPAQKKTVDATFMCHQGTADEYMAALVQLKSRSSREGVDFESFSDFTADMIPDFQQYANSIVDGTNEELRTRMWTQLDQLRKQLEEDDEAEKEVRDIEEENGNGGDKKRPWDDDDEGEEWKKGA